MNEECSPQDPHWLGGYSATGKDGMWGEEIVWSTSSPWMCVPCTADLLANALEAGISFQGSNLISDYTGPEARSQNNTG